MLYSEYYPTGKLLRARSICVMDDSLHGAGDDTEQFAEYLRCQISNPDQGKFNTVQ